MKKYYSCIFFLHFLPIICMVPHNEEAVSSLCQLCIKAIVKQIKDDIKQGGDLSWAKKELPNELNELIFECLADTIPPYTLVAQFNENSILDKITNPGSFTRATIDLVASLPEAWNASPLIAISNDGSIIAYAQTMKKCSFNICAKDSKCNDKTIIKIKNVQTNEYRRILKFNGNINTIAISSDNESIFLNINREVQIISIASGKCIKKIPGKFIALSSDANLLAFKCENKIRLFCLNFDDYIQQFEVKNIRAIAISYDSRYLAIGKANGVVKILDIYSGKRMLKIKEKKPFMTSIAINSDNSLIFIEHNQIKPCLCHIRAYSTLTGECNYIIKNKCQSIICSNDGKFFFARFTNKTTELYDTKTGKIVGTLGKIDSLATSINGAYLITSSNGIVKIWKKLSNKSLSNILGQITNKKCNVM